MSTSASEARRIMENLLKAKSETRVLRSDLRIVEADATRLVSTLSQLARGDVSGLIIQLTALGPYGIAAGLTIGGIAVTYGVYRLLTDEQPTELYFWRYPE